MSQQDLEQEGYSLAALETLGNKPTANRKSEKRRRRALGIMALEPRIMYDAAAVATAAAASDIHSDTTHTDTTHTDTIHSDPTPATDAAPTDSAPAPAPARHDIVIIDAAVPDIQTLINAVTPGDQIFILQGDRDGVQQIADIIHDNNLHDLSSIQIVSHGGQGEVRLGSTVLTDANLAAHADALNAIGQSLTSDGDILLYGCDVARGAGGSQFLADLSSYTGADIAAATHDIGKTAQGENWSLDAATGSIEATLPFTAGLADYQGLLANPSLSATQTWSFAPGGDVDGDGQVDPGDAITIAVTITNSGGDASNVQLLSETLSHLTVGGGNVRITPLAFDDALSLTGNTPITYTAAQLLANDIDPDSSTPLSNVGLTIASVSNAEPRHGGPQWRWQRHLHARCRI